jgi:hypothetical protein
MESNRFNRQMVEGLVREIGDRGTSFAWVNAWSALAADDWSDVEDTVKRVFRIDPGLAGRVYAQFSKVHASFIVTEEDTTRPSR